MNNDEKKLVFKLCDHINPDIDYLKDALSKHSTENVLGYLFFNRVSSIAYGVMLKNDLLNNINREFKNSLKCSYIHNIQRNKNFNLCVKNLSTILEKHKEKYAMLKGAVLCEKYPKGFRTSNDVDLLVRPEDVSVIGKVLTESGFRQGYLMGDTFVEATRSQIIESKITRGETVPYILKVDLPYMKYLEVDINFSLDYKHENNNNVDLMLEKSCDINVENYKIRTLRNDDFIIHLCGHLFKEATTIPWIYMKRDMSLYKFCDIYFSLSKMSMLDIDDFFIRANHLGMSEICSCVIIWTSNFFENLNTYAYDKAKITLFNNEDILNTVISPKNKKLYRYTEKNIVNRFFCENRLEILEEVNDETTSNEAK